MGGKSGPEGPARVPGRGDAIEMGRGGKIAADPRKEEEAVLRMGVTVRLGNEMGRDDVMERGGIETAHSAGRDIGPDEVSFQHSMRKVSNVHHITLFFDTSSVTMVICRKLVFYIHPYLPSLGPP